MGVSAAMGVGTRSPLWKMQGETGVAWKAKPAISVLPTEPTEVPVCAVGSRTGRSPDPAGPSTHGVPSIPRRGLATPGPSPTALGALFPRPPWTRPEVPGLPGSPPRPSCLACSPAAHPRPPPGSDDSWPPLPWALSPKEAPPSRSDPEPARASEREPGVRTGSIYYHVDRHRGA